MPPNIFYIQDEETNRKKVNKGLQKAEKYAYAMLDGRSKWGRVPFLSDLMNLISLGGLEFTALDLHQSTSNFQHPSPYATLVEFVLIYVRLILKMEDYPVNGNIACAAYQCVLLVQ